MKKYEEVQLTETKSVLTSRSLAYIWPASTTKVNETGVSWKVGKMKLSGFKSVLFVRVMPYSGKLSLFWRSSFFTLDVKILISLILLRSSGIEFDNLEDL